MKKDLSNSNDFEEENLFKPRRVDDRQEKEKQRIINLLKSEQNNISRIAKSKLSRKGLGKEELATNTISIPNSSFTKENSIKGVDNVLKYMYPVSSVNTERIKNHLELTWIDGIQYFLLQHIWNDNVTHGSGFILKGVDPLGNEYLYGRFEEIDPQKSRTALISSNKVTNVSYALKLRPSRLREFMGYKKEKTIREIEEDESIFKPRRLQIRKKINKDLKKKGYG